MINFASFFNQYRGSSNNLKELLDNSDTKIASLMEEESFISEFKSAAPRINLFMKYDKYEQLLDFVVVVGPSNDEKRSYKFPLTACEMLTSNNQTFVDFMLPEDKLIVTEKELVTEEVDEEVEIQEDSDQSEEISKTDTQETPKTEQVADSNVTQTIESVEPIEPSFEGNLATTVTDANNANSTTTEIDKCALNKSPKLNKSQFQSEEDEFGDFIQATPAPAVEKPKKKKKVIMKQVRQITREVSKEKTPLIYKLLSYFDQPLNYTLAGYTCKILCHLLTKKPPQLIKVVLAPQNISKILEHIESRSVSEFLFKLITFDNLCMLEERKQLTFKLFCMIGEDRSADCISSVSACVSDVLEKMITNNKNANSIKEQVDFKIIERLIGNAVNPNDTISKYSAPVLLLYLNAVETILSPQTQKQYEQLMEYFLRMLVTKLICNQDEVQLGLARLKLIETVFYLIKNNVLSFRKIMMQGVDGRKLMAGLLLLCNHFQYNNMLHNEVVKILDPICRLPTMAGLIFEGFPEFIEFLGKEAAEDVALRSQKLPRKGYVWHLVSICNMIKELSKENQLIQDFSKKPQFLRIMSELIDQQVKLAQINLGGYTIKRDRKKELFFTYQDILRCHTTFLKNASPAVYEPVREENSDLMEELRMELESNLEFNQSEMEKESGPAKVQEKKETTEEPFNEGEHLHAFFKEHLDYNIETLLNELV